MEALTMSGLKIMSIDQVWAQKQISISEKSFGCKALTNCFANTPHSFLILFFSINYKYHRY